MIGESKMKLFVNLLLFCLCSNSIFGGGTDYNPFAGSKTLALNGMYFAGTDNAFSFNPSAIAELEGFNLNFSLIDKIGQQEFLSPTKGLHRSYSEDYFSYSVAVSWKFDKLAFAVSYFPLINYNVSWPYVILRERNNTKVLRAFDLLSSMQVNSISPTAAYDLGILKVGISANIYMMKFKSDFAFTNDRWINGLGEPGYQFRYEEDGIGYGGTIGASLQLNENLKLGAVVRTPFKVDLKGEGKSTMLAELDSAASEVDLGGTFEMPLTAGAGIIFKLNNAVSINADFSYTLWGSTQKDFDYEIQNIDWTNRLNTTDSITGINPQRLTLNLENSFNAGLGLEYFPGGSVFFRVGYRYTQSPHSADTYNLLFTSVDTHNFSFGIGYFEEDYSVDLTLLYSTGMRNEISNVNIPVNSGTYDSRTVVPALTFSYKL